MDRKFAFLKTAVALSATLLAVSPWAAGTSNQEEEGKVYCVKRTGYDGEYYVQLSQQQAGYQPAEGETCSALWIGPEDGGEQGIYETLYELINQEDVPIMGLFLASDVDFGGYDESLQECNQQFAPIYFPESYNDIVIRSSGNKTYTVRGLCYITSNSNYSTYTSFAVKRDKDMIRLENINFEDVHLEGHEYVGLLINEEVFGTSETVGESSYEVSNVSVKDAVLKSSLYAGVITSQAMYATVSNFRGENISVSSQERNGANSSYKLSLGGLFGKVDTLASIQSVAIKNLSVTHSWNSGSSNGRNEYGDALATIGGLIGRTTGVTFMNVAIDGIEVADLTESGGSVVGGLVGFVNPLPYFSPGYSLQVTNTFSVGDIRCEGSTPCDIGFGFGTMVVEQNPSQYEWLFNFYANYHYSDNSDDASGFAGRIGGRVADSTIAAIELNTEGTLTSGAGAAAAEPMTVARGNFRNAVGDLTAGVFDTSSYVVRIEEQDGSDGSEFMNGVISSSAMKSASFAAAMDTYGRRFFTEVSNLSWQYDDRLATPYLMGLPGYEGQSQVVNDAWVTFSMDCVNFGCLTQDEERMLRSYENNRVGNVNGVVFKFEAHEGSINEKWVQFAYGLTQDNSDRDPVCWVMSKGKLPFAEGNVYTQDQVYTLSTDCEASAVSEAEIFLGEGVNYMTSPVTIMTFSKDSASGTLTEVSSRTSDGAPMFFEIGQVIYVYSSTPAITDGSKFKGWKLRAALSNTTEEDVLLERAKAGLLVSADENGYFDLGTVHDDLMEEFLKTPEGKKVMEEDEGDFVPVVAVLIYPEGFEKVNGIEGTDEPGGDEPGKEDFDSEMKVLEIVNPRILTSGNAVQFVAQTENFEYVLDYPYIAVMIENDDGELIVNDTIDEGSEWPEETRWSQYPLAIGNYLLTATIFNGEKKATYMQDFEVSPTIANGKADSWHMVSLWNVDFDSYKWSDDGVFYWWDESSSTGKFWQYQELSRKDSVEQLRGYWYNSLEGNALELKDSAFVDDLTWTLDSVNSGWNLVSNPYGWYVELGVEEDEEEEEEGDYNQGNSCDEKWEWLEYESHMDGKFDKEFYESQKGWVEEYCRSLLPAVEFWRWNPDSGKYDPATILAPYEAVWVKVNKPDEISEWNLSADPYFGNLVNADGENVPIKSLNKKLVLAKAAGKSGWALQLNLSDARGKVDNWNVLGAGKVASRSEEPPAGMGNRVNLSIMESGKRFAKSVKSISGGAYDWNVELSATSDRMGFLEIAGLDDLASNGLSVYVTVDGKTTKMVDGTPLKVMLSTTPKVANVHVGDAPKVVLARTLDGLKAVQSGSMLQVGFNAGAGLAGSAVRVDIVDLKGHVVRTVSAKAFAGANSVAVEAPKPGVYMLRVRAGNVGGAGRLMVK